MARPSAARCLGPMDGPEWAPGQRSESSPSPVRTRARTPLSIDRAEPCHLDRVLRQAGLAVQPGSLWLLTCAYVTFQSPSLSLKSTFSWASVTHGLEES